MKEGNRKEGNRNGTLKIFVCGVARLNDNNTRKEYKWGEKVFKVVLKHRFTLLYSSCCIVCVWYFKLLGKNPVDKQYSQPTAMTSLSGEVRHPLLFQ